MKAKPGRRFLKQFAEKLELVFLFKQSMFFAHWLVQVLRFGCECVNQCKWKKCYLRQVVLGSVFLCVSCLRRFH